MSAVLGEGVPRGQHPGGSGTGVKAPRWVLLPLVQGPEAGRRRHPRSARLDSPPPLAAEPLGGVISCF